MSKLKIVLLVLIAIFAVIYGVQLATSGKNSVETIILEEEIDSIRVTLSDSTSYVLTKKRAMPSEGTPDVEPEAAWIIDTGMRAKSNDAQLMENQLKDLKVVGSVSSMSNASLYDLQEDKAIIVEAMSDSEIVRTIRIGKLTDTMTQTYVEIDNNNEVVLISGDLQWTFNKTAEEIEYIEPVEGAVE